MYKFVPPIFYYLTELNCVWLGDLSKFDQLILYL